MNTGTEYLEYFQTASANWTCDGLLAEIRLIANGGGENRILKASVQMGAGPTVPEVRIVTEKIVVGRFLVGPLSAEAAKTLLLRAANGHVEMDGVDYSFAAGSLSYYSKLPNDEEWNYHLNLTCRSEARTSQDSLHWAEVNSHLRCCETPFDGVADVSNFLGLPNPSMSPDPQIDILHHAPADLVFSDSTFSDRELRLAFRAMPSLDRSRIGVGVRWAPILNDRHQAATSITWRPGQTFCEGTLTLARDDVDGALVMLSVGGYPARRQWVVGSHRAKNVQEAVLGAFDTDWRKLRDCLTSTRDSKSFERATATLAFLLGFQVAPYTDGEAPDLALFTTSGRAVLVECTLKTSDVRTKMGKLVDRRGAVVDHLGQAGRSAPVSCVLVCQSPRERILISDSELKESSVQLVCLESLNELLMRVGMRSNPDALLNEWLEGRSAAE